MLSLHMVKDMVECGVGQGEILAKFFQTFGFNNLGIYGNVEDGSINIMFGSSEVEVYRTYSHSCQALEYSSWYRWRRIKRGREESRGLKGFRERFNLVSWKSLR